MKIMIFIRDNFQRIPFPTKILFMILSTKQLTKIELEIKFLKNVRWTKNFNLKLQLKNQGLV